MVHSIIFLKGWLVKKVLQRGQLGCFCHTPNKRQQWLRIERGKIEVDGFEMYYRKVKNSCGVLIGDERKKENKK